MKLVDFISLLDSLDIPIAFSQFASSPGLPFLTYTTPSDTALQADNKNFHKIIDVDVELYTDKKDLVTEQKIEKLFDDNDIPYTAYQIYIDTEKVFQKTYELRLI